MRRDTSHIEDRRISGPVGYMAGMFILKNGSTRLAAQASNGGGWDHVSVSLPTRCPTWEEMCWVKDKFFEPQEACFQLHPAKANYVSFHPFCLHLWRPQSQEEIDRIRSEWGDEWPYDDLQSPGELPLPPLEFVAPKEFVKA